MVVTRVRREAVQLRQRLVCHRFRGIGTARVVALHGLLHRGVRHLTAAADVVVVHRVIVFVVVVAVKVMLRRGVAVMTVDVAVMHHHVRRGRGHCLLMRMGNYCARSVRPDLEAIDGVRQVHVGARHWATVHHGASGLKYVKMISMSSHNIVNARLA